MLIPWDICLCIEFVYKQEQRDVGSGKSIYSEPVIGPLLLTLLSAHNFSSPLNNILDDINTLDKSDMAFSTILLEMQHHTQHD